MKLMIIVMANSVPGEDSLLGSHLAPFLLCPCMGGKEEGRMEGEEVRRGRKGEKKRDALWSCLIRASLLSWGTPLMNSFRSN